MLNFLTKFAFASFCLCSMSATYAENQNNTATPANQLLSNVEVKVTRALKTPSGSYLLQMGSGYWKPNATLYDIQQKQIYDLYGIQKGNQVAFSSSTNRDVTTGNISLNGVLNVETGVYSSTLLDQSAGFKQELIFSPLVNIPNRPTFNFKFYGTIDPVTQEKIIHQIQVIDRKTQKNYQTLNGFSASVTDIQYIDLNLDGYFDLVLQDTSSLLGDGEQSIYWMYNPTTKKFQRSPQLEKLGGMPKMNIATREITFSHGDVYLIKNGQFYKIKE